MVEAVAIWLSDERFAVAVSHVLVDLLLGTAVALAAMLVEARVRQIHLGALPTVLLKLSALSITGAAAFDVCRPVAAVLPLGGLLLLAGEFVIYFTLLGVFFDLDQSDSWYCPYVIVLVRIAVYFAAAGVL